MTNRKTPISRAQRMENALRSAFSPLDFSLEDQSGLHAGHGGARPEGETHFRLAMASAAFHGLSRVSRQRLVYDLLRNEFETGLHALALDLKTPAEAEMD